MEEKLAEKVEEKVTEKVEEMIEEKVEEKIEEKVENKVEKKVEEYPSHESIKGILEDISFSKYKNWFCYQWYSFSTYLRLYD